MAAAKGGCLEMNDPTSVEALFVKFSGTSPAMVPGKASQAKFAM